MRDSSAGVLIGNHQYVGPDLTLQQMAGIGGAGSVFTLDAAQQIVGSSGVHDGGRLSSTTDGGVVPPSVIPETASLALVDWDFWDSQC